MSKSIKAPTATAAASATEAPECAAPADSQGEFIQRRAALENEGEVYTVRILGAASTNDSALTDLGKVANRLTKKKDE